jgi:hypothetical protein
MDFVARHRRMGFWSYIRLESCSCRLIIAGIQFGKRMMPRKMSPENIFPRRGSEEHLYQIASTFWLASFISNMSTRMDGPWIVRFTMQRVLGKRVRLIKSADFRERHGAMGAKPPIIAVMLYESVHYLSLTALAARRALQADEAQDWSVNIKYSGITRPSVEVRTCGLHGGP